MDDLFEVPRGSFHLSLRALQPRPFVARDRGAGFELQGALQMLAGPGQIAAGVQHGAQAELRLKVLGVGLHSRSQRGGGALGISQVAQHGTA